MEDMGDGREDSLVLTDDGEGYLELRLQLQWSGSALIGIHWTSSPTRARSRVTSVTADFRWRITPDLSKPTDITCVWRKCLL